MYRRSVHRNKHISEARPEIEIRTGCKLLPGPTRHRKPVSVAARSQQLSVRETGKLDNWVKLVFLTQRNCLILCTNTRPIFIFYWQFMISSLSLSFISYDVTTKNFVFDRLVFSHNSCQLSLQNLNMFKEILLYNSGYSEGKGRCNNPPALRKLCCIGCTAIWRYSLYVLLCMNVEHYSIHFIKRRKTLRSMKIEYLAVRVVT